MQTKIRQVVFAADVESLKEKLEMKLEELKKVDHSLNCDCEGDYDTGRQTLLEAVIPDLQKLVDGRIRVEFTEVEAV